MTKDYFQDLFDQSENLRKSSSITNNQIFDKVVFLMEENVQLLHAIVIVLLMYDKGYRTILRF